MKFRRDIGAFGILCASLGGIIGSGWLFGSLFAAQMAGPAALLSWVIGGVSIMFLALTFAELCSMFPISGGVAAFPLFTHGKLLGFILTWITWITYVVSISQEVQSTVLYMGNRFPSWVTKSTSGAVVFTSQGFFVAFAIMVVLIALNSFGTKFLARSNNLVSVWKLLVPIGVVVIFLAKTYNAPSSPFQTINSVSTFMPYGMKGVLSAVALAGVVYSFLGFQHGALLAGEAKNPQKSVPLALIGSLLTCIVLYCGLQYAFIEALPQSSLEQGWHNISFVGDAGPLAGIAGVLGLYWLVTVLYIDSIISPLGTGVLYMASSARIVQNMGTSGSAPHFFAKLSKMGAPMRAILLNLVVSMLAFLPFDSWQSLVSFLSSALVFSFSVGPICLVALRKQQPERKRPFCLPAYQLISFIAFYVCNMMIYWSGWDVVWKLGVTVGIGAVVFLISNMFRPDKISKDDVISALWMAPYLGILCVLSYYSSFVGGTQAIPLGPDFIVMAFFSLFIFWLSQKTCLPSKNSLQNTTVVLGAATAT